uniref:Long-chain-fatty-acid--CoA ligase n=2 Tax=Chromera velia TaxID=505693 RepID=A0A2K8DNF7_9ALVE|nr:Long-chain acyl-CoA synthetase [Chromera velia]|eukprot:Cvel_26948.t1-p1 / transcript=Cvel_26948.t1 / gene=Cvel_26948 / organism=Chromera_velia_CCMP2878 / gene_product=Long chain acyl-CoA synthetase 7, peroxisomal, putative / transcript_product=Long chain acyl-CoA synthetase 7, peroxisomal, putative / location=Cvel_scaffold3283:2876-7588(+) / protein_length=683 / sequence_SO=supercontig / SO=protein_coding / is_pseudo=false
MGNTCSEPKVGAPHIYSKVVSPSEKDGESGVYRCAWDTEKLYDGYKGYISCYSNFSETVKAHPDKAALGKRPVKDDGTLGAYEWKTWKEVDAEVAAFASGLVKLGALKEESFPDEKVQQTFKFLGVTGKNRPEYFMTMQASYRQGACLVPLYDTLGADTFEFIINQTRMKTVVAGDAKLVNQLIALNEKCPSLKIVIGMDAVTDEMKMKATGNGIQLMSFQEVMEVGKSTMVEPTPATNPEEINTICYTSGTTGNPKGAFVSHRQLLSAVNALFFITQKNEVAFRPEDLHISYLPYAHIFERSVCECLTAAGAQTAFYAGDPLKLVDDIQACKPTLFFSVPRLYARIYDKITSGVEAGSGLKKSLFNSALNAKLKAVRADGTTTHSFWDKIVFSKTKQALGGRVRYCLTGAAPMSADVQEFLKCCFCCPLFEGYGSTETVCCGGMTYARDPKVGTVGGPVPSVEAKILGIPEMNYSPSDLDHEGNPTPRGELLLRGPSVFKGYFQAPDKTAEALDEAGWYHTGDVVKIHPNGAFQIIDRAKNIFKLAQGEYIAPEKIENVYIQAPSAAQAFVHGTSTERYLVGVIVPSEDGVKAWAAKNGGAADMKTVCADPEFKKQVMSEISEMAKKAKLNGMEQVKDIFLWPEPFSVDNELLTPSFKLKRFQAKVFFKSQIDDMYAGLQGK